MKAAIGQIREEYAFTGARPAALMLVGDAYCSRADLKHSMTSQDKWRDNVLASQGRE